MKTLAHTGLRLVEGEEVMFKTMAVLYQARSIREYEGGSHGVSIRIARGLTYRVGASRGSSVSTQRISPLCEGTFFITNKRSVFVGTLKSFDVRHEALLAFDCYRDGLQLHSERARNVQLLGFDDGETAALTMSRVLNGGDTAVGAMAHHQTTAIPSRRILGRHHSRKVSPFVMFVVVGAALFTTLIVAAALAARDARESLGTAFANRQENPGYLGQLIASCGSPDRDAIRADGASHSRRLIYLKSKLELVYTRSAGAQWVLNARRVAGKQATVSLAVAETRLPCAKGLLTLPNEARTQ